MSVCMMIDVELRTDPDKSAHVIYKRLKLTVHQSLDQDQTDSN